ncbi:hypothetical protein N0V88_008020 [Collariella sp. IMI 366227]|nr:hypothetical protein N0V88_008020 [Collariella sp. IMI 366227]
MSCAGDCFDIIEALQFSNGGPAEVYAHAGHGSHQASGDAAAAIIHQYSGYTDIMPWQSRLIEILPDPDTSSMLEANLLVVDLIASEGAVVTSTQENLAYDALSYSWGRGPRDKLLKLDGADFAISTTLHAALWALRSPTDTRYLWVDQICINQDDVAEKSVQVAGMLKIYFKAATVHVWLGEASEQSDLAISALNEHYSFLEAQLDATADVEHAGSCVAHLQRLHGAVCDLLGREWFCRTWIRQESYAARDILTYCGDKQLHWNFLWVAQRLLSKIERLPGLGLSHGGHIRFLLEELDKNTPELKPGQPKLPRKLLDILMSSRHYQVWDRRDIVYASLGMCNIPATATHSKAVALTGPGITVDYTKTVSSVFQDILTFMLQIGAIGEAFHFRAPSAPSLDGLPSWALDWQRDACSEEEAAAINLSLTRHSTPRFGHIYTWCPLSPDTRKTYVQPSLQTLDSTFHSAEASVPFFAPSEHRKWDTPLPLSDGTLELPARVIDYVASLTDYTCDLSWLVGDHSDAMQLWARATPGSARERLDDCPQTRGFDPMVDRRRLAIMRTPANTHIALVPADTEVGDFLVAVAPDVLPLVLSPLAKDAPLAEEVYSDELAGGGTSKFASVLKGKGRFGAIAENMEMSRRRLERVVEVFGPHFRIKGVAFAMQGYDFYKRAQSNFDFHELRVERNWLRPIQRFTIH